jgi:hypothetical protein
MTLNSWEIFLQIVNRGGYSNTRQEISNPTRSYFSVEIKSPAFQAQQTTPFVHSSTYDFSAGALLNTQPQLYQGRIAND